MSTTIGYINDIVSKAGDLAETKAEILKLKLAGKVSDTLSSVILLIAIVALFSVAIIIISIGVAYWLGITIGNIYYGFFIVGGFYAIVGLFVFLFRDMWIKRPLSNLIIDKIVD